MNKLNLGLVKRTYRITKNQDKIVKKIKRINKRSDPLASESGVIRDLIDKSIEN